MKKLLFLILFISVISMNAQNIGIGTNNPHSSALLDIAANDKGILIPRSDTTSVPNPADGLLIFQNGDNQFYYYANSKWNAIGGSGAFEKEGNLIKQLEPNDLDDFVFGRSSIPETGHSNSDNYFFFDQSKGAFRGGTNRDNHWNPDSIGNNSFAYGYQTTATGNGAIGLGSNAKARGFGCIAIGDDNEVYGYNSSAIGSRNKSDGTSHILGYNNTALSNGLCFGFNNVARGTGSIAIGSGGQPTALYEVALGSYPTIRWDADSTGFNSEDRIFVLGNGYSGVRRDAFSIFRNGNSILNGTIDIIKSVTNPDSIGLYQKLDISSSSASSMYGQLIDLNVFSNFTGDLYGSKIKIPSYGSGKRYGIQLDVNMVSNNLSPGYGIYSKIVNWNTSNKAYAGYFEAGGTGNNYAGYFLGKSFFNGNVGIGEEDPLYKLHLNAINTSRVISADHLAPDQTSYSIFNTARQNNNRTIYGIYNRVDKYGTTGNTYGTYSYSRNYASAGISNTTYGLYTLAYKQNSGGTVMGLYASASGQGTIEWGVYCNGDMRVTGTYNPSDLKLKRNIELSNEIDELNKLLQLKVKHYKYKIKEFETIDLPQGERTGFIAQEIQALFPQYVKTTLHSTFDPEKHDPDMADTFENIEYLTVDYTALIPHMIAAIQGQQAIISDQENSLNALKENQSKQAKQIKDLENKLNAFLQAQK